MDSGHAFCLVLAALDILPHWSSLTLPLAGPSLETGNPPRCVLSGPMGEPGFLWKGVLSGSP